MGYEGEHKGLREPGLFCCSFKYDSTASLAKEGTNIQQMNGQDPALLSAGSQPCLRRGHKNENGQGPELVVPVAAMVNVVHVHDRVIGTSKRLCSITWPRVCAALSR